MTQTVTFHDLQGASVFITGGGAGIGAALTEGFLAQGAKVAFVQRSNADHFAAELAKKHGAKVNVVHCRAGAGDLMPQGMPLNDFARKVMMEQASELANQQENHLRGILHRLAREYGLNDDPEASGGVHCTFAEVEGRMADVVKLAGRLSDIIVLPKPQRERNLGQSSLKSAL